MYVHRACCPRWRKLLFELGEVHGETAAEDQGFRVKGLALLSLAEPGSGMFLHEESKLFTLQDNSEKTRAAEAVDGSLLSPQAAPAAAVPAASRTVPDCPRG